MPCKLACALVALIVLAPPLMACALPGMQMSDEEMACCRHMADQCGSPGMPDSHTCCKKSTSAQNGSFQIKRDNLSSLEMAAQVLIGNTVVVPANPVTILESNSFTFPESPPGHTSVLRI